MRKLYQTGAARPSARHRTSRLCFSVAPPCFPLGASGQAAACRPCAQVQKWRHLELSKGRFRPSHEFGFPRVSGARGFSAPGRELIYSEPHPPPTRRHARQLRPIYNHVYNGPSQARSAQRRTSLNTPKIPKNTHVLSHMSFEESSLASPIRKNDDSE